MKYSEKGSESHRSFEISYIITLQENKKYTAYGGYAGPSLSLCNTYTSPGYFDTIREAKEQFLREMKAIIDNL
ncbi:hypothetical protein [Piscirickettsia litoralis]|uniref:Uncharacterized protein n=1 Tax=Piscirickettsia litoralis TaxID=1891921 RepID=A0ABX2ZXW9_9GAMM|nr:hypothetical protein [Piscirickettsia litoralis]ODN41073.1 hypothetical protein BGC07_18165 [Piscirickettsia litoralis]